MPGNWILSALLVLPVAGALLILCLRGESEATKENARWIALWTTLITFVLSICAWSQFDVSKSGFQLVNSATGSRTSCSTSLASTASRCRSCS